MKFVLSLTSLLLLTGDASAFAPRPVARTSTSLQADNFRQPIMAGNWKLNPSTEAEALALATDVAERLGEETCAIDGEDVTEDTCTEVVIFPPFPFISKVRDAVVDAGLTVGAQNFYYEDSGAYTGSVSAPMIKSVGCEYVLCGHSERRTLFADSDTNINQKVRIGGFVVWFIGD